MKLSEPAREIVPALRNYQVRLVRIVPFGIMQCEWHESAQWIRAYSLSHALSKAKASFTGLEVLNITPEEYAA